MSERLDRTWVILPLSTEQLRRYPPLAFQDRDVMTRSGGIVRGQGIGRVAGRCVVPRVAGIADIVTVEIGLVGTGSWFKVSAKSVSIGVRRESPVISSVRYWSMEWPWWPLEMD